MLSPELYLPVYLHGMLLLVFASAMIYLRGESSYTTTISFNTGMLPASTLLLTLFLGTRPISGVFVDMTTYAASYNRAVANDSSTYMDWGFDWLMRACAASMAIEWFFFICSVLYVVPIAMAMRKVYREWASPAFLAMASSLSFFAYGTNGIRNGIATSLLIWSFAYHNNATVMAALMFVAASMHKSILVPMVAFLIARYFANVAIYATCWIITFILVTLRGEAITALFSRFTAGSEDERLSTYVNLGGFANDRGGYRLDFVLYSIAPVAIAYWLADARTRGDALYRRLVCAYLSTNMVWLLLMYAAYSNRFAYLSWCFMPWVIIYPFMGLHQESRGRALVPPKPNYSLLAMALIAHYAFTYAMDLFILPARGR